MLVSNSMNAANTRSITTGGPGASGWSPERKTNERNHALLIVGGLPSFSVLRSQSAISTFNTSCRTAASITFRLQ